MKGSAPILRRLLELVWRRPASSGPELLDTLRARIAAEVNRNREDLMASYRSAKCDPDRESGSRKWSDAVGKFLGEIVFRGPIPRDTLKALKALDHGEFFRQTIGEPIRAALEKERAPSQSTAAGTERRTSLSNSLMKPNRGARNARRPSFEADYLWFDKETSKNRVLTYKVPKPSVRRKEIDVMSGIEFETYCANTLQDAGWTCRVTKASGDQGVDIIAMKGERKVAIQCKRYKNTVGNSAVQQVFAAKAHENADYAVVVTNSDYTKAARELAKSTNVGLLHYHQLGELDRRCR